MEVFGAARSATFARELTKTFETVRRGALSTLADWIAADADQRRGEIVLVVAGTGDKVPAPAGLDLDRVLDTLLAELSPARAAAVAARLTGLSRREAYTRALQRTPAADGEDHD